MGKKFKLKIESKFDTFFLAEINQIKLDSSGWNRNKLRFYSTLKGCFKPEFHVSEINNRLTNH